MESDVRRRAGLRLRRRRETLGWSRDELATRAGVSVSLLAQLERGEANPSLSTLDSLADAARMTLSELVAAEDDQGAGLQSVSPTTMWRGRGSSSGVLLVGARGPTETELWRYEIAPGDAYEGAPHLPGSQILVHILEGTLELSAADDTVTVDEGASVRLRSDVVHRYANTTARPVTFVLVYTRVPDPSALGP